jgi:hypothetical protein
MHWTLLGTKGQNCAQSFDPGALAEIKAPDNFTSGIQLRLSGRHSAACRHSLSAKDPGET